MADFDLAIAVVLRNEGGYVSDPGDPGGETKYGISKHFYPGLDISALTVEAATEIYRRDFWRYDGVTDQAVANKVFDLGVNIGMHKAVKLLQQSLPGLVADGAFGPETLAACNAADPIVLLSTLKNNAVLHYREVARTYPALKKFLAGWMKRAMS